MASRCFNGGKPQLNASDNTHSIKAKTIFNHNKNQFTLGKSGNYEKTICYDSNNIKKVHDFDTYLTLNYGLSLCDDCSGTDGQIPAPDTEYGPNTTMTMAIAQNLVDISCNAMIDSSCNLDMTFDASENEINGWIIPAPGEISIIDPSNIIMGDYTDCEHKQYLNLVTIAGIDLSGNNTSDNYLRHFQHPRKIKLT